MTSPAFLSFSRRPQAKGAQLVDVQKIQMMHRLQSVEPQQWLLVIRQVRES